MFMPTHVFDSIESPVFEWRQALLACCLELVEFIFEVLEFLAGLCKFALSGEALVVSEIPRGGGDQSGTTRADGAERVGRCRLSGLRG
jgi:hypothetical protein